MKNNRKQQRCKTRDQWIDATGLVLAFMACLWALFFISCQGRDETIRSGKKLQVVTTLFPLYDFARNIGQDRADVSLLLPPGLEPHSFEPKPGDIIRLNRADIFIYTSSAMEPWATDVVRGLQNRTLKIIASGDGIAVMAGRHEQGRQKQADDSKEDAKGHGHGGEGSDPHIWLDFANAAVMVDHILTGFIERDPLNKDFYRKNADAFKGKLHALDRQFREGLSGCRKKIIVHGGHFAFGYLAARYGLKYASVSGFSPDAEPTPENLVKISRMLRENGLHDLFYDELVSPKVAEAIAGETGASLLMLHGAHNVGKEDFERGVTFIDLMQRNLQNLKRGLQCPPQP